MKHNDDRWLKRQMPQSMAAKATRAANDLREEPCDWFTRTAGAEAAKPRQWMLRPPNDPAHTHANEVTEPRQGCFDAKGLL